MAWGCFCWIPCPYKKWNEDDRQAMLNMFPLVGLLLAIVLAAAWVVLDLIHAPWLISGILLSALYFMLTGFIHMDGFMDVSDAIMSRRPELEERQRILKDSNVGAFAVISVMIMSFIFAGSMMDIIQIHSPAVCGIIAVILVSSRAMSAICVISCPPMSKSQYREMKVTKSAAIPAFIIMILAIAAGAVCFIVLWPDSIFDVPGGNPDIWLAGPSNSPFVRYVVPVGVTIAVSWLTGAADRKSLGGMNGDISGHMITLSEMAGIAALALVA